MNQFDLTLEQEAQLRSMEFTIENASHSQLKELCYQQARLIMLKDNATKFVIMGNLGITA